MRAVELLGGWPLSWNEFSILIIYPHFLILTDTFEKLITISGPMVKCLLTVAVKVNSTG